MLPAIGRGVGAFFEKLGVIGEGAATAAEGTFPRAAAAYRVSQSATPYLFQGMIGLGVAQESTAGFTSFKPETIAERGPLVVTKTGLFLSGMGVPERTGSVTERVAETFGERLPTTKATPSPSTFMAYEIDAQGNVIMKKNEALTAGEILQFNEALYGIVS